MNVVIDGNIGSGKTTQLDMLERKGWFVKREPIDKWPLELFYNNMSRWAFLLQIRILQTIRPQRSGVTIYERGLLSTRHVFWEWLVSKKMVTEAEHETYEAAYERYVWYPDIYIYLAKPVELSYEHVQKRHQTGDSSVTLNYMKELAELYEKMLPRVPCCVHVINANRTPEEIHAEVLDVLSPYIPRDGVFVSDDRRSKV
jgi:deoxyadenosine/deoxycytidine kinase